MPEKLDIPNFIIYNKDGKVDGLNQLEILAPLVGYVQSLKARIGNLETEVDSLKNLVCLDHPQAEVCR